VIRIIRLATSLWDRDTVHEQERIIGRRRNGQWLDGTPSTERVVFATDLHGKRTPLDSHVRRAAPNPRTPAPMVRRSYNYNRASDDQWLVFSCFQSDVPRNGVRGAWCVAGPPAPRVPETGLTAVRSTSFEGP
jgi:deferrochelatase/peroxidase EfeB